MNTTQLSQAPEGAVLRTVDSRLCVAFKDAKYDVSPLKLTVGDKVVIAESEFFDGEVCAFMEDTTDTYEIVLKKLINNKFGSDTNAPAIGAKE